MIDLKSKEWRLNNLYRIVTKNGSSIPFKLNTVQQNVLDNIHNRNLILKARQLGMSTFAVLYMLDEVLFNRNIAGGIVSYSLEHAQHIFKKIIGHALDTFPDKLKPLLGILQRSAREITFNNGSSLRVDTTLRGGSYPLVLVSEFGKTCARNPQKAEEVITGTLQAVPKDGRVIIESTGEGSSGYFSEMVLEAHRRGNDDITELDYKLFFYPWYSEPTYTLKGKQSIDVTMNDYFDSVEKENDVKLSAQQRNWYIVQSKVLNDKIRQEFPSTVKESFLSSSDAYYFAAYIELAYQTNRCLHTSLYDALLSVYVAMDIGVNDLTVIVFFQIIHGEIRVIDYYEDLNKGVDFYAKFLLQDKPYHYDTIFLPHDSKNHSNIIYENTYERDFRRLFSHTQTRFHVLKRMDKNLNISHAKIKLDRCVFNINRVKPFVDQVSKYRKKWSEQYGKYLDEPYHDISSNYADALIYMCQAVGHIEATSSLCNKLQEHKKLTENRSKRVI